MKRSIVAIGCVVLALAVPALAAAPAPALRLISSQPLTVKGIHFKSHERVRVTEHIAATKRAKIVRASATGTFKVSFAAPMAIDPCLESARITAIGARGSDAALKLPQRACPPSP